MSHSLHLGKWIAMIVLQKSSGGWRNERADNVSRVGCGHDTLPSRPLARERAMSLPVVAIRAPVGDG